MNTLKFLFGVILYGGMMIVILAYFDIGSDRSYPIINGVKISHIHQPAIQTNTIKATNIQDGSS